MILRFSPEELILVTVAVALLFGLTGGWLVHRMQAKELEVLPVVYSAVARLQDATPTVSYYAAVNDMVMSVAESWNSVAKKRAFQQFDDELKKNRGAFFSSESIDHDTRYREILRSYGEILEGTRQSNQALGKAWSYRSQDHYRTEWDTETYTDSQGNTQTRTVSRQVYDDSEHWFDFDQNAAIASERLLTEATMIHDSSLFDPKLESYRVLPAVPLRGHGASPYREGKDNSAEVNRERDLYKKTVIRDESEEIVEAQLVHTLNQWLLTAHGEHSIPQARSAYAALRRGFTDSFESIHGADANYYYRTTSTSHSGPREYQTAQSLAAQMSQVTEPLESLFAAMRSAMECAKAVTQCLASEDGSKRDNRERAKRLLDAAIDAYRATFPTSTIDIDLRPRTWLTVVSGFAAASFAGTITWLVCSTM